LASRKSIARVEPEPVIVTAACELGTHRCRGVVLYLTDANLTSCQCPCHLPKEVAPLTGTVYLLHFIRPIANPGSPHGMAQHYIGWSSCPERRINAHVECRERPSADAGGDVLAEPARPRRAAVAAGLCCRFVDAETVNNLGGACQIVGVLLVVRDLLPVTRYRGVPGQVASWLRGRRAKVTALARQLFRRPPRHQVVHAGGAEIEIAPQATLRSFPGPFTARPGQSLEDRIAQLGHLVNRLRDDVEAERNERRRAISEERQARQRELRAETQQRQAAADALGQEFQELQEVTTGGVRLRWEGVPFLLVGVGFTTWPDGIAAHWPGWLPWRLLVVVAAFDVAASLSGALDALAAERRAGHK
jgi:hypothetical protein